MKRYLILFLIAACSSWTINAQNQLITIDANIGKPKDAISLETNILNGNENIHYMYRTAYGKGFASNNQKSHWIFTINSRDNTNSFSEILIPKEYFFVDCFENENEILALYYKNDTKENRYSLYLNTYPKGSTGSVWAPKQISSFIYEEKDKVSFSTRTSPDKSKFGLIVLVTSGKKNIYKGALVTAFNNQGETLWDNELNLEFTNKTFSLEDYIIDNDGNTYFSIISYKEEKKQRFDQKLHIYIVTENNISDFSEDISFGYLSQAKSKILKNGDLFVGGYYCENQKEFEKGCYALLFDTKRENTKSLVHQDFENYNERNTGGFFSQEFANQKYQVTCEDIFELDNGNVVLLGEQRAVVENIDQKGFRTYVHYTKNIIYNCFNSGGEIVDFKMFKKVQVRAAKYYVRNFKKLGISYHPFVKGNSVYLLFNDNINNYIGKKGATFMGAKKTYCTVLMKINENGEEDRKVVINSKIQKKFFYEPLFIEDDGAIIVDMTSKALMLEKLSLDF